MKIIYYVAASIDGYIADAQGGVSWLDQFNDGTTDYGYASFYASIDALIMGRATYSQVLTFGDWPYAGKACAVVTRRSLDERLPHVKPFNTIEKAMAFLSRFERVWLIGGSVLAGEFLNRDLIDELVISRMPVILGRGIPLFNTTTSIEKQFDLSEQRSMSKGVIQLCYSRKQAD